MKTSKASQEFEDNRYRSWHLARSRHDAVTTEFEWATLRFQQAFERWVMQLSTIIGFHDLSSPELVLLHVVKMHDVPPTAATLAYQLNRSDIPNIQYSLRKLSKMGFVRVIKGGPTSTKNVSYAVSKKCSEMLEKYAAVRRELLTEGTKNIDKIDDKLSEITKMLSILTGMYDEAGRTSATYK